MTTIIFALLAAFVVWKLRSVLGTRSGTEKPPFNPFARRAPGSLGPRPGDPARDPVDRVIPLPGAAEPTPVPAPDKSNRWKPYAEPDSPAWAGLDAIVAADPSFAIKPFAEGAKAAYEMIVTAFAAGNREVLRNLLAPERVREFRCRPRRARKTRGKGHDDFRFDRQSGRRAGRPTGQYGRDQDPFHEPNDHRDARSSG